MPLEIPCSCGKTFRVADSFAGREVRCTFCGSTHTAPGGDAAAEPRCPNCGAPVEAGAAACGNCNENLARRREEASVPTQIAPPKGPPPVRVCGACDAELGPADAACPRCGGAPVEKAAVESAAPHVLWEDSSEGIFARYWKTWSDTQFKFDPFFRHMRWEGGYGQPLGYVLFLFAQMAALACLCGIPFIGLVVAGGSAEGAAVGTGMIVGVAILYLVILFVAQVVGPFISAAVYHVCALMFGGKGTYEATFRGVCYTSGAQVWTLAPYIGGLAALVFQVIGMVHALHYAHGLTKQRAVFAVLLPVVVCCGVMIVGVLAMFTMIGSGGFDPR